MHFPFDIIFRAAAIYLFIIVAIRLFGKRELSQLSIVDLVLILLISNSVQNAMVGSDSSLVGGLVAAATLFVLNWILKNLLLRSKKFNKVLQGSPVMLVYKGHIIRKHLMAAEISEDELNTAIREHGVENIEDIDLAILEVDGNISVLSHNFQKKTLRKRRIHKSLNFSPT